MAACLLTPGQKEEAKILSYKTAVVLTNLRLSPSVVGLAIVVDIEGHPSALLPIHDPVQRFCTGRSLKKFLLVADVIIVVDGTSIQRHNHFHIVRLVRNHVDRAAERKDVPILEFSNHPLTHPSSPY